MRPSVTFFPVGNGDMTLVSLGDPSQTKLLIDCNIRETEGDHEDSIRDVAKDLRARINSDRKGRPYVDVLLLSHPDQDHCRGIREHFYLGPPEAYPDDKKLGSEKRIVIREIWSSPLVFRRACTSHPLSEDAKAFNTEAKRRVEHNRKKSFTGIAEGNRIIVLGEDEDGKTDDLEPILVKVGQSFSYANGSQNDFITAHLLAPLPKSDDDEVEETLSKNHSSVILNIDLRVDDKTSAVCSFLTAGDAEVAIWEQLWQEHSEDSSLEYDMLLTPHHCSWHSLSHDSWSELHEKAEISDDALSALSQIRERGVIVASSNPIVDDDNDPPCHGAKREYENVAKSAKGAFHCTGEYPDRDEPEPLEFLVTQKGFALRESGKKSLLRSAASSAGLSFPNKPVVPNKPAGFA